MYSVVQNAIGLSDSQYKYVQLIGKMPVKDTNPIDPDCELKDTEFLAYIPEEHQSFFREHYKDLVMTKSTTELLDISVRKMDQEPCLNPKETPFYSLARDVWARKWTPILTTELLGPTAALDSMDLTKAPGVVITMNGYKTKHDYFAAGGLSHILDPSIMKERVYWKAAGKLEKRLRSVYYGQKKMRTFIIEPTELLYHHKRIYGKQNLKMKMAWWSAYGLNPYEGGTNRIAERINKFKYKFMLDARNWDRIADWMGEVWILKNSCLSDDEFKQWVTDNNVASYVVLPNGDIIYKKHGNNSGSGSTTQDNILGMSFIVVQSIAYCCDGDPEIMENLDKYVFCQMFGDDVVGGIELPPHYQEKFEEAIRYIFLLHKHELDPFIISEDIGDMTFLGFGFEKTDFGYVPKYDLDLISTSFIKLGDDISSEGELSKMICLTLMSVGHGEYVYNIFRDSTYNCILNVDSNLSRSVLYSGLPTYNDALAWTLGLESKNSSFFAGFVDFTVKVLWYLLG
jgi:hypothetical protein